MDLLLDKCETEDVLHLDSCYEPNEPYYTEESKKIYNFLKTQMPEEWMLIESSGGEHNSYGVCEIDWDGKYNRYHYLWLIRVSLWKQHEKEVLAFNRELTTT